MSQAILKRSLEILEDDLPSSVPSKSSKQGKKSNNKHTHKDSVMDLIPERHRLTCTKRDGKSKSKQTINKIKSVDKYTVKQAQNKLKRQQDRTEENVRRLMQLDEAFHLDQETTELMFKRARVGHYVIPEEKPKDTEDVFTAADFEKFEREYFVS